jgi:hypothetical protein
LMTTSNASTIRTNRRFMKILILAQGEIFGNGQPIR